MTYMQPTKLHSYPQSHDPSDLRQGSRALAFSNTRSPRFTDIPSNLANLIGWEYKANTLHMLRKSGPARALDPCRRSERSWLWGREWPNSYLWLHFPTYFSKLHLHSVRNTSTSLDYSGRPVYYSLLLQHSSLVLWLLWPAFLHTRPPANDSLSWIQGWLTDCSQ